MTKAMTTTNPFGNGISRQYTTAMVDIEQSRAIAEAQASIAIAKRFPRDPIESMDKIINACTRKTLAESALYTYARGGTDITGPSIRLAEAIAQCWGNLSFGIRELEQNNNVSTVEAYAWDMESNTKQQKIFQVKHIRYTKKGDKKLTDPRDIYEHVANNGARRLRACILGIIPGDVVEAAVNQCNLTLKNKSEITPENIQTMIEKFSEYGVSKKQIEKRIQRRVDAITPALMVSLRKIYNSLKDGMSVVSEWFDVDEEKIDLTTIGNGTKMPPSEDALGPDPDAELPLSIRRSTWINKKSGTFNDFIESHHHEFAAAPDHIKSEAAAKYQALYKNQPIPKCLRFDDASADNEWVEFEPPMDRYNRILKEDAERVLEICNRLEIEDVETEEQAQQVIDEYEK